MTFTDWLLAFGGDPYELEILTWQLALERIGYRYDA